MDVGGLRRGYCGAVDILRQWGKTPAFVNHRHTAIHRSHDDLPKRGIRLWRTFWAFTDDSISVDLGGVGDLFDFAIQANAASVTDAAGGAVDYTRLIRTIMITRL